ncbi:MAG: peroxide stress protein YaaA [Atopobiaceae bacterium]|jgi:cytoplasmic iron level regulating protein YaaA (DUF328/UPF0246 family)
MQLSYVISPAKKMNVVEGPPYATTEPVFLQQTKHLAHLIQSLSLADAQALWKCSDKLAALNYERFQTMDLDSALTAAVLAYEGIQYQHLAPQVLDDQSLIYLEEHMHILSGFYGALRATDAVVPYRLEMQAKLSLPGSRNLYEFWGDKLWQAVSKNADAVINLASVEYSHAIAPYVHEIPLVTCLFCTVREDGKLIQKSTEAKAARGTFMRWCAEHAISDIDELTCFNERSYAFDATRSDDKTLVFVA